MPKPLFTVGVVCCFIVAAFAAAEAVNEVQSGAFRFALATPGSLEPIGGIFALGTLVFAVPVGAMFVRMASLLAARNLFDSYAALVATACTSLSLIFFAMVQLRVAVAGVHLATGDAARVALGEANVFAFYTFIWFLSLALLALRPYFLIRSSRTLGILVCLPLPLFVVLVAQQIVPALRTSEELSSVIAATLFLTLTVIFAMVPIHSLRHRHLFLEATNLRELLDSRVDPSFEQRTDVAIRGGAAFES